MKTSHLVIAALLCLAWGVNAAAAKVGVTYVPPLFFTAMRFLVVLVLLSPWLRVAPVGGQWRTLLLGMFFLGALHFGLIFTGAKLSSATAMAIVNQLWIPMAALMAFVWLGEKVPLSRWIGIAIAFAGVLVFSLDRTAATHWSGIVILVIDAGAMALGTVLLRRLTPIPPLVMQAWMAAIGFPLLALASFAIETGQFEAAAAAPPQEWIALAYTIIGGSLIGHTLYYFLLQRYEVSLVSSILLVSPVIGVMSGVLLLGEPFTIEIAIGTVLTLGGVAIVLIRSGRSLVWGTKT